MNTILCFGLVICATLALTSAYPAAGDAPVAQPAAVDLEPAESRHGGGGYHGGGHHGGGHHGGGHHGGGGHYGGGGHGGYGRGGGWGR